MPRLKSHQLLGLFDLGMAEELVDGWDDFPVTVFDETPANPTQAAVEAAVEVFCEVGCDSVVDDFAFSSQYLAVATVLEFL